MGIIPYPPDFVNHIGEILPGSRSGGGRPLYFARLCGIISSYTPAGGGGKEREDLDFETYLEGLRGKTAAVIGIGVSNRPLI